MINETSVFFTRGWQGAGGKRVDGVAAREGRPPVFLSCNIEGKAEPHCSWRATSRETIPLRSHPNEGRTCTRPRRASRPSEQVALGSIPRSPADGWVSAFTPLSPSALTLLATTQPRSLIIVVAWPFHSWIIRVHPCASVANTSHFCPYFHLWIILPSGFPPCDPLFRSPLLSDSPSAAKHSPAPRPVLDPLALPASALSAVRSSLRILPCRSVPSVVKTSSDLRHDLPVISSVARRRHRRDFLHPGIVVSPLSEAALRWFPFSGLTGPHRPHRICRSRIPRSLGKSFAQSRAQNMLFK